MNYDLLWTRDEYLSLLDYKRNSLEYIDVFLNEGITDYERRFDLDETSFPKTSEDFKKSLETIETIYKAIKKNEVLTGINSSHEWLDSNNNVSTNISLDDLTMKYEQYRQNLMKLREAINNGTDTSQIETEIIEFKRLCSEYLRTQFNRMNMELQQSKTQERIQIDKNSTIKEVYIGNTGRMFSIKTPDGNEKYYFKPAEAKDRTPKAYRAYIQEAAYNMQRIVNPERAVKCNTYTVNGMFGAVQEKAEVDDDATEEFMRYFYGIGDELSPKILNQIFDEYLVDYCLCNYDSHARNFIIDTDGNLRGVDKEQSFRYIDRDVNDDMLFSVNYNARYGEIETVYATIFKKIMSGEISYKVLDGLHYRAARLAQVPDEQYRQLFKDYAYDKAQDSEEAEALLDRIVQRKQNIVKKVEDLIQYMYNQSLDKEEENVDDLLDDAYDNDLVGEDSQGNYI